MASFYYSGEIIQIAEILKNKLYFGITEGTTPKVIRSSADVFYFSVDDELVYVNYYYDFGPLNISCLYKYCCKVNNYLKVTQPNKKVIHHTSSDPNKKANAAYLIGAYAIIYLKMEPRDIYKHLFNTVGPFRNFVDASQGVSNYTIRLLDCFQAIEKALSFNFFNFSDFNVLEYDTQDKLQHGDMNWLLPRKFLAFIGPTDDNVFAGHPPDFYINYFLKNDVKTIIRLNNKVYDSTVFQKAGIDHNELFFPDGSTPPKEILLRFLNISENAPAAIGVHCKAGLGRTGSLIGAFIIKHYRLTAREAIAWMRICRPGSVIGQQQGWLEKIEGWLWRQGSQYRLQHYGEGDKIPRHRYGIYSMEWPRERERLIKQAQIKRAQEQSRILNSKTEESKKVTASKRQAHSAKVAKHHEFEKKRSLQNPSTLEYRRISKILSRVAPLQEGYQSKDTTNVSVLTAQTKRDGSLAPRNTEVLNVVPTSKMTNTDKRNVNTKNAATNRELNYSDRSGEGHFVGRNVKSDYVPSNKGKYHEQTTQYDSRSNDSKDHKLRTLQNRFKNVRENISSNLGYNDYESMLDMDKTQGDRLNDLKIVNQIFKKYKFNEQDERQLKKALFNVISPSRRVNKTYT